MCFASSAANCRYARNVVDAVVKSLRKKLGAHGGAIATVTGHGYRFGARGTAS